MRQRASILAVALITGCFSEAVVVEGSNADSMGGSSSWSSGSSGSSPSTSRGTSRGASTGSGSFSGDGTSAGDVGSTSTTGGASTSDGSTSGGSTGTGTDTDGGSTGNATTISPCSEQCSECIDVGSYAACTSACPCAEPFVCGPVDLCWHPCETDDDCPTGSVCVSGNHPDYGAFEGCLWPT